MITIGDKTYYTDDEWMLLLKQNETSNIVRPVPRFFRKPLCPICHKILAKTMVWQPVLGTMALPFSLNNFIWTCGCGYKFADGDSTRGEFKIQNTVQYQCLDPETGKDYDDQTCQDIYERVNILGNLEVQKELSKLKKNNSEVS